MSKKHLILTVPYHTSTCPVLIAVGCERGVAAQRPATTAGDDSARCLSSGICETQTPEHECIRLQEHQNQAHTEQFIPFSETARRRDAALACEFTAQGRAERVRDAARWTWKGYRDCAAGWDELRPLSCTGQHWHNLTLTPIDALDTLFLMDLFEEFDDALRIIDANLDFSTSGDSNLFETTIRIMGGLLSAHTLTNATRPDVALKLLNYAVDLGARLLNAFDSSTFIPFSDINLSTGSTANSVYTSSLSEVATLSLEWVLLSRLSGEYIFQDVVITVHDALTAAVEKHGGLLPQFVAPSTGQFSGDVIMLGARSDSYYEYLLKQYVMSGCTDVMMLERFVQAMRSVRGRLLRRTQPPIAAAAAGSTTPPTPTNKSRKKGLLYVAEEHGNGVVSPKMDHLVCFLPGVFALADFYNISTVRPDADDAADDLSDLEIAAELAETCYQMYRRTPSGLAPEIVFFKEVQSGDAASEVGGGEFSIKDSDSHSLLRPETVESLFLMWKVTGDPKYRQQAWLIFRAFERWTRNEGAQQCFAGNPEAAMVALSTDAAHRAATVAAQALMGTGVNRESAVQKGVDAAKVLIDGMKLFVDGHTGGQSVIEASLGAARAAANATVYALSVASSSSSSSSPSWKRSAMMMKVNSPQPEAVAGDIDSHTSSIEQLCGPAKHIKGGGYSSVASVTKLPPPPRDKMESFWIAETLKYLYLIFTEPPDRCLHPTCQVPLPNSSGSSSSSTTAKLPLTKFVFNTEAHPLIIVGPDAHSLVAERRDYDRKLLNPPFPYGGPDPEQGDDAVDLSMYGVDVNDDDLEEHMYDVGDDDDEDNDDDYESHDEFR